MPNRFTESLYLAYFIMYNEILGELFTERGRRHG